MRKFLIVAAATVAISGAGLNGAVYAQSGSDAGNNAVGQPGSYDYSADYINASRLRARPPGSASISESRSYGRAGMNGAYVRSGAVGRTSASGY